MKKSPLRIGALTFEYPFLLAPLAGITDRSMRSLCSRAGASLTFTEMVSAKGLWYGDRKTGELLRHGWGGGCSVTDGPLGEGPVGFQLFGCEPEILEYAAELLTDPARAKAVDAAYAARFEEMSRRTAEKGGALNAAGGSFEASGEDPEDGVASHPHVNRPPMGARTVLGADGTCIVAPPAVLDLNAGCPVPKIVRNGEGSALLKDPDLLYKCVSAMCDGTRRTAAAQRAARQDANLQQESPQGEVPQVAAGSDATQGIAPLPVTVKIRKGFEAGDDCAVEIARAAEAAGAAAITVHGRTRRQFYEGKADWDAIARVKAAVKIPVIGNGDVMSGEDAIRMMSETGCDGVMIARGALGNPWIFEEARALWDALPGQTYRREAAPAVDAASTMVLQTTTHEAETRVSSSQAGTAETRTQNSMPGFTPPTDRERIDQLLEHIDLVCADKGADIAVREMRKHVGWYIRGMRGAAQLRRQVNTTGDVEELKWLLREWCAR